MRFIIELNSIFKDLSAPTSFFKITYINLPTKIGLLTFLLAALILPFKPQPALACLAISCLACCFCQSPQKIFKELLSSPISIFSLLLFGSVCSSYFYSLAPAEQKTKFLFAYRELLLLPLLLFFMKNSGLTKSLSAAIFFVMTGLVIGISSVNFLSFYFGKPFFDVPSNDNFIFHSHIIQNVMGSVAVLYFLLQIKNTTSFKLPWFFFVFVAFLGILNIFFMVQGRTGHLSLLACIIVFIFFSLNKTKKILSVGVFGIGLVIIFNTNNYLNQAVNRTFSEVKIYQETGKETSAGARIEFWKYAISHIKQSPLIGHGAGSFRHEYKLHIKENNQPGFEAGTHHPHNEFLLLWHDAGLVAFILYCGFLFSLARQGYKAENSNVKTMRFGVLVTLLIYSLVDVPLFNSAEALFFVLMITCFFQFNLKELSSGANYFKTAKDH